jgi:eukaryotic-like serine/threonine-protein kinase
LNEDGRKRLQHPRRVGFHVHILVGVLRRLHYAPGAPDLCDFDGKPPKAVLRDVSPQNVMLTFAG